MKLKWFIYLEQTGKLSIVMFCSEVLLIRRKSLFFDEFNLYRSLDILIYKMTTKSQRRKSVPELVSGEIEASVAENCLPENLVAGPSKTLRVEPENLEEIKTSLGKEIMSDLTKVLTKRKCLS